MSKRNENRPGYKKTKVGWIPISWKALKFKDACRTIMDGTHFSPKSKSGVYRYITSRNIRYGYFDLSQCSYISEEEHDFIYKRCSVKKGDVLLTKDGAQTGNACINILDEQFGLLSSVAVLDGKKDILKNDYLLHWVLSPYGQFRIKSEMAGQAITRLTLQTIESLFLPLPPLPEQKKIAEILSTWDVAIEQTRKLIDAKKHRKKPSCSNCSPAKNGCRDSMGTGKNILWESSLKKEEKLNTATSRYWQLQGIKASFPHRKSNVRIHPMKTSQNTKELCQVTLAIIQCACGREFPPFQLWRES